MIVSIDEYLPATFDRETLKDLQKYFDIHIMQSSDIQCQMWFENLYHVAKHDIGIAHCINQHQSSRNSLAAVDKLNFDYREKLGCFSVYHDIDTVQVKNSQISGIKNWISSIHQADYLVCKVGHHSDPDRCLVFLNLDVVDYQIDDNEYDPIGLKIARPMRIILESQPLPDECILHQGSFLEQDAQNIILSFLKYGFLTNFLGCTVGLYHAVNDISNQKRYQLDFQLEEIALQLEILKQSWQNNFEMSRADKLDRSYWRWHDTQYNLTKKCLTDLLKLVIEVGGSRFYDSKNKFSQRFRDALVWSSHGKSYYEQILLTKNENFFTLF